MSIKVIPAEATIISAPDGIELLKQIELAGRVCYKSEDKITDESCKTFVANVIKRGHEAVIEHGSITVRFICDRGVSHEIVRHRVASYCQESTRYCNYGSMKYGGQITFIKPATILTDNEYALWLKACQAAEDFYLALIDLGATPQVARAVLPNSVKTELVMTANPREWRHFFKLRTAPAAHPDMQFIAKQLLSQFKEKFPVLFDDINP